MRCDASVCLLFLPHLQNFQNLGFRLFLKTISAKAVYLEAIVVVANNRLIANKYKPIKAEFSHYSFLSIAVLTISPWCVFEHLLLLINSLFGNLPISEITRTIFE